MKILMCRPDYFGIEYEINPWMHIENQADRGLATEQWNALYRTYQEMGVEIVRAEPRPGVPDMVFSANAGLVWNGQAVLSRFQHPERQKEEPFWRAQFEALGLTPHSVGHLSFEGAGDGLFVGSRLFMGHGFRTDPESHEIVGRILDVEVISLKLINPHFYHLDTCFCPLNENTVIFAPEAFSRESAQRIRDEVTNAIPVSPEIAAGFACNGIVIDGVLVSSLAIESVAEQMAPLGLRTRGLAMSEFMKAGGGVRCLSLPLDLGR